MPHSPVSTPKDIYKYVCQVLGHNGGETNRRHKTVSDGDIARATMHSNAGAHTPLQVVYSATTTPTYKAIHNE